ncbi:MAG TPA: hypothetical protein VGB17_19640 [Pyrinomonadaceae bacterium]
MKTSKALLAFALVCSLWSSQAAYACGPFSFDTVFTFTTHPEFPLEKFAAGRVGILQPTYARSYLFAAYRNLNGAGFSPQEQQALVNLWHERLDYKWEEPGESWFEAWFAARKKVVDQPTGSAIDVYRHREKPNEYETYLNCQKDAFQTAASTLESRIKQFGPDHSDIKDWVRAQDEVFANCSEGQRIPAAASPSADPLIRADRSYQIAAANFYAGNLDEARKQFEAIASDAASPWRSVAAYLSARALLRKASLGPDESRRETLAQAEARLDQILKDRGQTESHHSARRLMNLVRLRLHPEEKLRELARTIVKKEASENFRQDVWDYTILLDQFVGEDQAAEKAETPAFLREDDLTDWIITFQSAGPQSLKRSLQKWEKTRDLTWLVAALSKVDANHPNAAALLKAASQVKPVSAAFPSLAFHTIRILIDSGRTDEARRILDELLIKDRQTIPQSSINLFLGQRMGVAASLDEFLKFAQRRPAGFSWDDDGRQIPADMSQDDEMKQYADGRSFFDVDSVRLINQSMPLVLLKEAAMNESLPKHLRRDMAQAAWIRALMLDDAQTGRELVPVLSALLPEIKPLLEDYQSAQGEAKRFAGIYAWLKFPGLEPVVDSGIGRRTPLNEQDNYRDNWWCSASISSAAEEKSAEDEKPKSADALTVANARATPPFLLAEQRAAAARQNARLNSSGAAPNYISRQVIAWAEKNPQDARVPEALHLAVKTTRYGCIDKETGRWSKAAFDLLHKRYPTSSWARKTPHWFKEN